ncbi:LAME_0C00430g1_1 [Lachancea meyersii CBS 8951]|uniref:LAME_0C00430g1_1 n=1 Tax=Lachancea meyersii CBS 8951 TaxID=1266667 RepID=A0A1G4IYH1_9SACH|nr:LAME_0C00430g1_1 [Lachancea meyersii CBS 8951]
MDTKKSDVKVTVRDQEEYSLEAQGGVVVKDIYVDPHEEAALVRKLDRRLLPMLAFMYFLSSLDRSNIGNAYTSGMKEDLHLTSRQYSNAVSVFYSTYLAAELPAVWLLKIARPRYYMSGLVLAWSLITLFSGFVQKYESLLATRVLLGAFEGGFFPAMTLLITMTYKPQEQAKRIAFFFGSSALSGAFGGLIATGLASVNNAGGLEGWRWLYIIEGLISVFASVWLFFGLPDSLDNLKFLNSKEHALMNARAKQRVQYMGENPAFSWKEVLLAIKDFKTYFAFIIQFCQDTILYGFSTFLTAILKLGLGYDSRKAQYMSVPVYLLAAIVFMISAYVSDRFKVRGPVFFAYNLLGATGYIILLTVKHDAVKYFACYLITFSLYTGTGLNITWLTNNVAPHYKRATALGLNQTLGNLSGAIVGQVYTKSPYVLGNSFSLGCIVLSNILTLVQIAWLTKLNRDKAAILAGTKKDFKKERIGDEELDFKYCL